MRLEKRFGLFNRCDLPSEHFTESFHAYDKFRTACRMPPLRDEKIVFHADPEVTPQKNGDGIQGKLVMGPPVS